MPKGTRRGRTTCTIGGCNAFVQGHGLCKNHYQRWYRNGDPLAVLAPWGKYDRPLCGVEGCERRVHARGLCTVHGPRWRRHGDPLAGRRCNLTGPEAERFAALVVLAENGCWLWAGGHTTAGYSEFFADEGEVYAHRWSYEHSIGPIPDGLTVDHTCHNRDLTCPGGGACLHRGCVNSDHLEAVSFGENTRRGRERMRLRRELGL